MDPSCLLEQGNNGRREKMNHFRRTHGEPTLVNGLLDVVVHAESCAGMEVASQLEGRLHGLAISNVRQQTQLQLTVVSHNERVALSLVCCEGFADLRTTSFIRTVEKMRKTPAKHNKGQDV